MLSLNYFSLMMITNVVGHGMDHAFYYTSFAATGKPPQIIYFIGFDHLGKPTWYWYSSMLWDSLRQAMKSEIHG